MISTKTHAILDYLAGALLIIAPYAFGFANGGAAQWVPMILGAATILYSLTTRYEFSVAKVIQYPTHLVIDAVSGVFLLACPWLLGFADEIWLPYVAVGIVELLVVSLSWGKANETV